MFEITPDIERRQKLGKYKLKKIYNPEWLTVGNNRVEGHKNLIKAVGCRIGIEIGVREGFFSRELIHSQLRFLNGLDIVECTGGRWLEQCYPSNYKFHVGDSLEMYKLWPDEWFDIIHIDDNHREPHVKKELELWWPKLKKNGICSLDDFMAYHDYNGDGCFGVMEAVEWFSKKYNVPYYMIGANNNVVRMFGFDNLGDYAQWVGEQLDNRRKGKRDFFKESPNVYFQKL